MKNNIIIKKSGFVLREKGMGNSHGGAWRPNPNKPDDRRYLGEPDTINRSRYSGKKGGYERDTKIGPGGKATKERHYTDHGRPDKHTDPHDHLIEWNPETGVPLPGPPINYPNGAPTFKLYRKDLDMKINIITESNTPEQNRFTTISDFKWCLKRGGEIEFEWKNKVYCAFGKLQKTPDSEIQMCISEAYKPETEKWCDNADEVLEYKVGEDRLRDVITKVTVWDRTI